MTAPFWSEIRRTARVLIQDALDEYPTGAEAARALGLNRTHMYALMGRLGMRVEPKGNAEWRSLGVWGSSAPRAANSARHLR